MREFPKPIVVVSKCIEFEAVRWNAQIISSDTVDRLKPHVIFVLVCPEVGIGLGIPRETLRIVSSAGELRLIQPNGSVDLTEKMRAFADHFLNSLDEVDGFILKSGSPSSALKDAKIYPKIEKSAPLGKGPGFFGAEVLKRYPNLAIEDEKRLLNARIREHFLTRLFTLADYRMVRKSASMRRLLEFHSNNKLLLTAYSQEELHVLGRLVADQKSRPHTEIIDDYEKHLQLALMKPPRRGSNANVVTKAMGYFSKDLSGDEKSFFLSTVDRYRRGSIPLSTVLSVVRAWIIRYSEEYLMKQTFLEPYPEALTEIDSVSGQDEDKDYWK
jgi:uncharacterized protein YbgA (DUF1722 family)/uncharacterized protein YbbK (DUF523 family)